MTLTMLFACLLRFENYIASTGPAPKVTLLLKTRTAHGTQEIIPRLAHENVLFLPFKHSPKLLSLNFIIYILNKLYCYRKYVMALDSVDAGRPRGFHLNL